MAGQGLTWQPFTPATMPPIDNQKRFLVLYGLGKADRIICVGVHCQYGDHAPYIRTVAGSKGWKVCTEAKLRDAAWAAVEITEQEIQAVKRRRRKP